MKHRRFWCYLAGQFLAAVGVLALGLELLMVVAPEAINDARGQIGAGILGVSLLVAIVRAWPRTIAHYYVQLNTSIRVLEGDLFDLTEPHLVIGMCTTFDTDVSIIAKTSVQAQFLDKTFGGDVLELDRALAASLVGITPVGTIAKPGKTHEYELGTVATIKDHGRCYFCLAYTKMDQMNVARADVNGVWKSLDRLWIAVCEHANGGVIAMPAIGGGQSRLSSVLPLESSIRLTAMSFHLASRRERLGMGLDIIVPKELYAKLDHRELQAFLSALPD